MDRRQFLGAAAATGASLSALPFQSATGATGVRRVAVIGAGIVGASIAYNLAKRDCEVILLDKQGPAAQASGNSFAWLNASYFDQPRSYFQLRTHSLNEYHRLAQDVDIPLRWGGSLEWYDAADREKEVREGVARIQGFGAPVWMIDPQEVAKLEPHLDLQSSRSTAYCSRDGAVDPAGTTRALVARVAELGGRVIYPATVSGIQESADQVVVQTDVDSFVVDLVVVAAGTGANDVAAMLELDTKLIRQATPGIIVTTRPMDALLNTVAYTTDTHFHQQTDGRVIVGEKAGPPSTAQHFSFLREQPNAYPTAALATQHATQVLETAGRYVPQLRNAEVENVGDGWRPLPLDGLPIIGRPKNRPGVYLASMHSGVTLAPIVGHLAAMEILDGVTVDLLDDFRLERLLDN